MPVTTIWRSPSPIDLTQIGVGDHKTGIPFGLYAHHQHRRSISGSTISSATSTFSSILDDPPHYGTQPKLPFNNVEAWTLYDFECHARCCSTCQDTYHHHITTSETCHTGHGLAQKVVNLVYSKAGSYTSDDNEVLRFTIPAGHVYVKDLLLAVESKVRRRRLLTESRAYRQRYSSFDKTYDVQARRTTLPVAKDQADNDDDVQPDSHHHHHLRLPSLEAPRPPTRGKPVAEIDTPAETLKLRASSSIASAIADTTEATGVSSNPPKAAIASSPPTASTTPLPKLHQAHDDPITIDHVPRSRTATANHIHHRVESRTTLPPASGNAPKLERRNGEKTSRSRSRSKTTQPRRTVRWSWFLT